MINLFQQFGIHNLLCIFPFQIKAFYNHIFVLNALDRELYQIEDLVVRLMYANLGRPKSQYSEEKKCYFTQI